MDHAMIVLYFPFISGVIALVVGGSIALLVTRRETLAEPEALLMAMIRQTVFGFLSRQYRYFFAVAGLVALAIGLFKLATHEIHSALLPMGIALGIVLAIAIELSLAIAWTATLKKGLSRLKDSPEKSRQTICIGSYAVGLWAAGLILVTLSVWFGWVSWVLDTRHSSLFQFLAIFVPQTHTHDSNEFRVLEISLALLAPSFSAGLYALFSRLSTGIFAKTADLSADITGRTEFDLPEDDLRNPAVMADLGGDILNLLSIATALVQAVLFSVCVTGVIGLLSLESLTGTQWHHIATVINTPLIFLGFAALGACLVFPLLLNRHVIQKTGILIPITGMVTIVFTWIAAPTYAPSLTLGILCGLVLLLGTGFWVVPFSPAIAHSVRAHQVHAINGVFSGFAQAALGLIPAGLGLGILFFEITQHFFGGDAWIVGTYKLGLATTGMMSMVATILMFGGFAALSDILKGCSDMLAMPQETRAIAAKNDSDATVGSTVIKTYLITASIPLGVMISTLLVYRVYFYSTLHGTLPLESLSLRDLFLHYDLFLSLPAVWMGILLGVITCFLATSGIIMAVQRTAKKLTQQIRTQLSESNEIWAGNALPDYESATTSASTTSLRAASAIVVALLATPVIVIAAFGLPGAIGFIMGMTIIAYVLGLFFNLMGALWRCAKKRIEQESGVQSAHHLAAVFTDSIGDVLKDALAPSYTIMANICGIILILAISLVLR